MVQTNTENHVFWGAWWRPTLRKASRKHMKQECDTRAPYKNVPHPSENVRAKLSRKRVSTRVSHLVVPHVWDKDFLSDRSYMC